MDVEDDDIRFHVKNGANHVGAGACFTHDLMAKLGTCFLQEQANGRVILNDDEFQRWGCGCRSIHTSSSPTSERR
jgi:hypothetical protein